MDQKFKKYLPLLSLITQQLITQIKNHSKLIKYSIIALVALLLVIRKRNKSKKLYELKMDMTQKETTVKIDVK